MWHHPQELDAVRDGVIDHVLYVSEFQKAVLAKGYGPILSTITGNYIDPQEFLLPSGAMRASPSGACPVRLGRNTPRISRFLREPRSAGHGFPGDGVER
ncbi:MAG: hypothetical protein WKF37_02615 [Bryobacteraceae bacterium]